MATVFREPLIEPVRARRPNPIWIQPPNLTLIYPDTTFPVGVQDTQTPLRQLRRIRDEQPVNNLSLITGLPVASSTQESALRRRRPTPLNDYANLIAIQAPSETFPVGVQGLWRQQRKLRPNPQPQPLTDILLLAAPAVALPEGIQEFTIPKRRQRRATWEPPVNMRALGLFPTLLSISPTSGGQDSIVTVHFIGTNFDASAVVNVSGTGVTAGAVSNVTATSFDSDFTIDAAAAATVRTVTVTTDAGTTGPKTFQVLATGGGGSSLSYRRRHHKRWLP